MKSSPNQCTPAKQWWNQDLGYLAKQVRKAQREWEINKSNTSLRDIYSSKQKEFSKAVRKAKRVFRRKRELSLLDDQKKNPKKFWDFVKNLDCAKGNLLPSSVISHNGVELHEKSQVLHEWERYFNTLLNSSHSAQSSCIDMSVKDLNTEHDDLNDPIFRTKK